MMLEKILPSKLQNMKNLSLISYTYEKNNHFVKEFIKDLDVAQISKIQPKEPFYQFYNSVIEVFPKSGILDFKNLQILMPKMEKIHIRNRHKSQSFIIH